MQAMPCAPMHNIAEEAVDEESEIAGVFFFGLLKWQYNMSAWLGYLDTGAPV